MGQKLTLLAGVRMHNALFSLHTEKSSSSRKKFQYLNTLHYLIYYLVHHGIVDRRGYVGEVPVSISQNLQNIDDYNLLD